MNTKFLLLIFTVLCGFMLPGCSGSDDDMRIGKVVVEANSFRESTRFSVFGTEVPDTTVCDHFEHEFVMPDEGGLTPVSFTAYSNEEPSPNNEQVFLAIYVYINGRLAYYNGGFDRVETGRIF